MFCPFLFLACTTAAFTPRVSFSAIPALTSTNRSTTLFSNRQANTESNTSVFRKLGWDKDPPKSSLVRLGKSYTASQWMLNAVEAMHWIIFIPALASAYAVMEYRDVWFNLFDGDALRVTLWLLAPVAAAVAGLAPIMAHVYEDWQIGPTRDPVRDEDYNPSDYVNGRLREVAYGLLFTGLGISGSMSFIAYQGYSLATVVPCLLLLMYGALGNKKHMVSDYLTPLFFKDVDQSIQVVPVSVPNMVFFVFSQIMAASFVYGPLASQVNDDHVALKVAIMLPQLLFMTGGILDACVAEIGFDQRVHFAVSFCLSLGAIAQAWANFQLGQSLRW
jgi:hypothetical protein